MCKAKALSLEEAAVAAVVAKSFRAVRSFSRLCLEVEVGVDVLVFASDGVGEAGHEGPALVGGLCCGAVQWFTCNAILCNAVQRSAVQCSAARCSTVQRNQVQCSTVPYSALWHLSFSNLISYLFIKGRVHVF